MWLYYAWIEYCVPRKTLGRAEKWVTFLRWEIRKHLVSACPRQRHYFIHLLACISCFHSIHANTARQEFTQTQFSFPTNWKTMASMTRPAWIFTYLCISVARNRIFFSFEFSYWLYESFYNNAYAVLCPEKSFMQKYFFFEKWIDGVMVVSCKNAYTRKKTFEYLQVIVCNGCSMLPTVPRLFMCLMKSDFFIVEYDRGENADFFPNMYS